MAITLGKILKPFFRISTDAFRDMAAERYGPQEDMYTVWQQFEPVAGSLVKGFYMTLDDSRLEVLMPRLNELDVEVRGVAYEGIGMGLTLLDSFSPWKKRLQTFLDGPGESYTCLVYIGVGLVLPRMPVRPERVMARLDPLLRWFVMDGYGFYEGFFSLQRTVEQHMVPKRITGYARRAFDHGLGRCIWFSTGANVQRVVDTMRTFPQERQADLWGGIGTACAYAAGVVDRPTILKLQAAAGRYAPQLATGAALAAKFREQAGTSAPHTELACEVLWGLSGRQVAHITDEARLDLPADGVEPAYETWRQRIAKQFVALTRNRISSETHIVQ